MMKPIREHETLWRSLLMVAKILAFFGLSSCGIFSPRSAKPTQDDTLSVLFIGNSYSFDVPGMFDSIAKKNGKKVRVSQSTHGGWTLAMHAVHEPTLKLVREGQWDIVVIQDHSLHPARQEQKRRKEMYPYVRFFVNEARAVGAKPMLYQTWGRRDGQEGVPDDDFFNMNARVREGYRHASENAGEVEIVPVGDAWETEFRNGNGNRLFIDDGSHPSKYGNRVSARVFYETIFRN